ncbi:hypothetical protein IAQ61_010959 [Plenodomus lingam]|uniref:Predicted protein n=1 Tax=Leptosphaeria maculans (strain JN3 / isolate v23.1.3 / race Av1-4-5-6-7-8) TaxID=985895 RepID=E4ZK65_LEPMJ|nr:predicted protein [Plenodomus lingam JN3]KAH9861222.1 hypothetical protein IAQ61_010959 [Plenodomus lingam]CBX91660.1 predicted protein [Plenodomus lingam JN3]
MPPSSESQDDAVPLSPDHGGPRPYQPYCVTEASISRPQSPDLLTLELLRVEHTRKPISILTSTDRTHQEIDINIATCSSSPTTTPASSNQVATLDTGSKSNIRSLKTNRKPLSGNTRLIDSNHIAQAVTPRGSHLLAPGKNPLYDKTLSPRLLPNKDVKSLPDRGIQGKSPRSSNWWLRGSEEAPLLGLKDHQGSEANSNILEIPLHIEQGTQSTTVVDSYDAQNEGPYVDIFSPLAVMPQGFNANDTPFPAPDLLNSGHRTSPALSTTTEGWLLQHALELPQVSPILRSRVSSQSPHASDLHRYHVQSPYSQARGLPSEIKEDWAHRRTESKDAQLRYEFGRRPSFSLDRPPSPPLHQSINHASVMCCLKYVPSIEIMPSLPDTSYIPYVPSLPTFSHPLPGQQAGPRPPPWISFENLEAQRRQRGDARERADTAMLRMKKSSSLSLYQASVAGDETSLVKGALYHEVEEYRVAVLSVYPDMDLDGESGKGDRECCYCIVM